MTQQTATRQHETTIEIPAPADEVWKAITEASEVRKWFAPAVRIDPRVGGEYFVSWGPGMEGTGTIEAFEPGRRLRVRMDGNGVPLAVDYILETRGGNTLLRLVHSGFLTTSDWDAEYDGTKAGWPVFLWMLRYGLIRHPGTPGGQLYFFAAAPGSAAGLWARLMGSDGLRIADKLDGLGAGSCYSGVAADGQKIEALIEKIDPGREMRVSWRNQNDALLFIACAERAGLAFASIHIVLYGIADREVEEVRTKWTNLLQKLFPGQPAATAR